MCGLCVICLHDILKLSLVFVILVGLLGRDEEEKVQKSERPSCQIGFKKMEAATAAANTTTMMKQKRQKNKKKKKKYFLLK